MLLFLTRYMKSSAKNCYLPVKCFINSKNIKYIFNIGTFNNFPEDRPSLIESGAQTMVYIGDEILYIGESLEEIYLIINGHNIP